MLCLFVLFNIAAIDDVVFFEVLNAHPGRRSHVLIHYQDTFTNTVHISRRRVLYSDSALSRFVLVSGSDQLDTLPCAMAAASDVGSTVSTDVGYGSQAGCTATTPSAGGSTRTAASSDGAHCTEGQFKCACCQLYKPSSMMKMRGNQAICTADANNYSALSNRWKNNKALKAWWQGLSLGDKQTWYRKEQSHMAGTKRTFDQTAHEEFAGRKHQSLHLSLNNYVPLLVFVRNKFAEGISRAVAQQMFEEIVMRRTEACIYENGQWHVPDYAGIAHHVGTIDESGFASRRIATDIRTAEGLSTLVAVSNKIVEESASSASRQMQSSLPEKPPECSNILRNPADQGAFIPGPMNAAAEIMREVCII